MHLVTTCRFSREQQRTKMIELINVKGQLEKMTKNSREEAETRKARELQRTQVGGSYPVITLRKW